MKFHDRLQRGARFALLVTMFATAATGATLCDAGGLGGDAPYGRIATLGQREVLVVAQAPDPHAGHGMTAAPGAASVHKAEGVVRSLGDEIVIKHGPIASMGMGAMTMAYKAPKGGVPKDVKPGTNVKFEFVMTPQGDMQLTSIVPGGGGAK